MNWQWIGKAQWQVVLGSVTLGAIFILGLITPALTGYVVQSQLSQTLGKIRSIQLAAQRAALDGESIRNPALCWPGDNTNYVDVRSYLTMLAKEDYFPNSSFSKFLSAPGWKGPSGTNDVTAENIPYRIYKVRASDPPNTIFLTSKNLPPFGGKLEGKLFDGKYFVIIRKDGSGAIYGGRYKSDQSTNQALLGTFPSNYFEH